MCHQDGLSMIFPCQEDQVSNFLYLFGGGAIQYVNINLDMY